MNESGAGRDMTASQTYTYEDLKSEFKLFFDGGDPWGSTLSWLHAACEALTFAHEADVPESCGYKPSIFGQSEDEDGLEFSMCKDTDPNELYKFAELLSRYADFLRRKGLDY